MMTAKQWQWFPSEAISWHLIQLPKGRRWRDALAFCVEEKLAESVEQLRIVPTLSESNGLRWVAVIRASFWQSWLAAQPNSCAAYCPDVLALPYSDDGVIYAVIDEADRVRLRWGQWQGAAGQVMPMTALLTLLQRHEPRPIIVYAQHLPEAWKHWSITHHPINQFVEQAPTFDLHDGGGCSWFRFSALRSYRLPLVLMGCLLMVWVAHTTVSAVQAQAQTKDIKQRTEAQFSAAFPEIKRRINPLVQAKSELTRRQQARQAYSVSFLSALQTAQSVLVQFPPVQQMNWQHNRLTLSWSEAIPEAQRQSKRSSDWQVDWLSDRQCALSQGRPQ